MPRWIVRTGMGVGLVLALLLLAALVGGAAGALLPESHRVVRSRELPFPRQRVWRVVADLEGATRWRRGVVEVEELPALRGRRRFRERSSYGTVTYELEGTQPPERLIVAVVDNSDFGGRWIYDLAPTSRGVRITITEEGQIHRPLFRLLSRFVFGYARTLEGYLDDLEAYLEGGGGADSGSASSSVGLTPIPR